MTLSDDSKGRVLLKPMVILKMDFLQDQDLTQQTGYIILFLYTLAYVIFFVFLLSLFEILFNLIVMGWGGLSFF